jgi:CubicO group peptidase (beta-lactamase class C family)
MRLLAAAFCLAATLALALSAPANAQTPEAGETHEWEGFVDGVMAAQKEAHHVAGAVVVIVHDGRTIFQKGYGFADLAARKPVDPTRTLFRVASNSKMFTWTAVMQLVEAGRLDLRADVSTYMKGIRIPPTFPQPITLEHLMTHTAGFEDRVFGLFSKEPDTRSLGDILRTGLPARVSVPGSTPAYSNYGAALAGLIVEQVSGIPYEKYVEDRILTPLAMDHAAVRQPVPARLAADLSKGYKWTGGRFEEEPFEYAPWTPAAGMSVSGHDMGRFMLAHLGNGAIGDARILRAESAKAMQQRLVSFSPKIDGMLHGFIERNVNGETAFGHTGATIWFHSATLMVPARNLGVFVAYNTDTGQRAAAQFVEAFADHLVPVALAKEPPPPTDKRSSLARFTGSYATTRASESGLTKLVKLFTTTVTIDTDGYLVLSGPNETTRWREIEPLVFTQVDGNRRLVFRENAHGDVLDFCAAPTCSTVMRKQPWYGGLVAQGVWLGACLTIFVVSLIAFPVAAVSQRQLAKPALARLTRLLAWLTSLVFVVGFGAAIGGMTDVNGTLLLGRASFALRFGLALFVVGSILAAALAVLALTAWQQHWWRVVGRVSVSLVAIAGVAVAGWLYQWNLLGWRY